MSTRSGRIRPSLKELSPPRTRKGVSPPRSPARARKSSPPAPSPSRKSPSRKSPSRKSPSRKTASKFPARKSPSRTTKEATETAAQKSPGKLARASIKSGVTVKLQDITKLDIYRGTRSGTKRSEYSIKDLAAGVNFNSIDSHDKLNGGDYSLGEDVYGLRNRKSVEEILPRRSSRLREFIDSVPDIRRSLSKSMSSKSVSKSVSQSIDAYSDEENSEEELLRKKSDSVTRKLATPLRDSVSKLSQISSRWEFGGRIGTAVLALLLPVTVIYVLVSCKKTCIRKSLQDLSSYKPLSVWFSYQSLAVIMAQWVIQAAFALLPILGTKSDRMDETGTKYTFNAFFSSIFTLNVLFALNYFNILKSNELLIDYPRLATVSYIFAVVLATVLYLKSRRLNDSDLNPYGNTGYVLYDFCLGRELHPKIKKLDIKIWISRIANINALILAVLIFKNGFIVPAKGLEEISLENVKEFLSKVQFKPTILLYSMMQIVYILNFVMKEYKITSTFFWQSEGVGYLQLVSSALYPFYFTTISKFVSDTDLSLSTNILIAASVLYLLGFLIMLASNNIKYDFRNNPLQPSLSNLDSMPTFHGKKLLISGLWGVLRHPNYTGDILIHIAFSLPGLVAKQYLAAVPGLVTIVVLVHRAWRDHSRCRRRYGAAWERYCKRVPKVFIPKVL